MELLKKFLRATTLTSELISRYRTRVNEAVKSESGLVLIDSLVGTVILSIALVALIYTSTTATRTTTTSTERTQAMYIAQATLEGFKRFDGQPAINTAIDNPMVTVGNVNYRVGVNDVTVTDLNTYRDTTTYNLRTLQVTVGWPFAEVAGTEPHQIAMIGYFYAHP